MSGSQRGFNFGRPASVLPGSQRGFTFGGAAAQEVLPEGFDAALWGDASLIADTTLVVSGVSLGDISDFGVAFLARTIQTTGWLSQGFGPAEVKNQRRFVQPAGFDALRWGSYAGTIVWNFNKELRPVGLNAFAGFGAHWVSLGTRRIYPAMGVQTQWGTAALAGGVRWLDLAGRGIAPGPFGSATVWFRERQLFPQGNVATLYGLPRVDHDHPVDPVGWDSLTVGEHEVHTPRITLDVPGIPPGAFGETLVQNWIQEARPVGWMDGGAEEQMRFGRPEAYNLTQYLFQIDAPDPNDGGVFGTFTYVDNRNKVPRPGGWVSSRLGTPEVRNNARIVTTQPNVEFTLWGNTLVADANRELRPAGWDSFTLGHWLTVHNDARVLGPAGWDSLVFGAHGPVWSNQQTTKPAHWDSQAFGAPMVAFSVRTVAPFSLPPPPPFGAATVQHLQRYVVPAGFDAWRHGLANVREHFTIIAPNSILPGNRFGGDTRVRNVTPELHTFGAVHTEWGTAQVYNQFERYEFQGFSATLWGKPIVRDRRFWVTPNGIAPLPISTLHQVRNVIPDPPAPQPIGGIGWDSQRFGTKQDDGGLIVGGKVIYPTGSQFVEWGVPTLTLYGLAPVGITPPYDPAGSQFGRPSLNATQWVQPLGVVPPPIPETHSFGPHYIWAPKGYPYGAEKVPAHTIDYFVHGQTDVRPSFGPIRVEHRNRTVAPSGFLATRTLDFGEPRVSLRWQFVRPEGLRSQRFGFPKVGEPKLAPAGFDMALYGTATVVEVDTGPKTARPSGIAPGGFGTHRVEFLHREVAPQGWVEFRISNPTPPAWPRTSHWVANAYPPFEFSGDAHTLWGDAWVSHSPRTVEPVGTVMTLMDGYTLGEFALRMRVWKRDYVRDVTLGGGEEFGTAWVEQGQRPVAVRGIAPGGVARPQVIGQATIEPDGFDACVFGDVQQWEAGKIKPHGDDLAAWGRAILSRAMHAQGFEGEFGMPSIGRLVVPAGWEAGGIGDPVAVAGWCGNKAVAVQGSDMAQFGEATVTT